MKLGQSLPPLHQAVAQANLEQVAHLLARKADLHTRSETGATPLHLAVEQGCGSIVHLLLTHGANARLIDHRGFTPLHSAASAGEESIAADLIMAQAGMVNTPDNAGQTPLHVAAAHGHAAVVEVLLAHDAKVDARDRAGRTPLHEAVPHDYLEAVCLLIASGANVNAPDHAQRTPLHIAASQGCLETVELLLSKQAAVDARDHAGRTALHDAALHGSLPVANALLRCDALLTAADNQGQTPLDLAVKHHLPEMAAFLHKRTQSESREQETAATLQKSVRSAGREHEMAASRPPAHSTVPSVHAEAEFTRLEARVQQLVHMFDELLTAFPDQVYLCDVHGRFSYVNPSAARFWGKRPTDLLGKSWHDLELPVACVTALQEHYLAIFSHGESCVQSESVWPTREGMREFSYVMSPLHQTDGTLFQVVCIVCDISLRKQAEIAIRDANARIEALTEQHTEECAALTARVQAEQAEHQRLEAELHASMARFRLSPADAFPRAMTEKEA